jgi:hypothetical protein
VKTQFEWSDNDRSLAKKWNVDLYSHWLYDKKCITDQNLLSQNQNSSKQKLNENCENHLTPRLTRAKTFQPYTQLIAKYDGNFLMKVLLHKIYNPLVAMQVKKHGNQVANPNVQTESKFLP